MTLPLFRRPVARFAACIGLALVIALPFPARCAHPASAAGLPPQALEPARPWADVPASSFPPPITPGSSALSLVKASIPPAPTPTRSGSQK